jgi:hypothetical protein
MNSNECNGADPWNVRDGEVEGYKGGRGKAYPSKDQNGGDLLPAKR